MSGIRFIILHHYKKSNFYSVTFWTFLTLNYQLDVLFDRVIRDNIC